MTGRREPDMLTAMTERDWSIVLACLMLHSRTGESLGMTTAGCLRDDAG